jgi:hypothetical protein
MNILPAAPNGASAQMSTKPGQLQAVEVRALSRYDALIA